MNLATVVYELEARGAEICGLLRPAALTVALTWTPFFHLPDFRGDGYRVSA